MINNLDISWRNDYTHFEALAQPVYEAGRHLLLEMYGPKCDTYDGNCVCCRRWRLLEQLVQNPFDRD